MRKIASVRTSSSSQPEFVRLMICKDGGGYFLFLYDTKKDGPCRYDLFLQDLEDAEKVAYSVYGVCPEDWQIIPNYPKGCQQDWIVPTKRILDADGNTRFVKLKENT